MTPSDTQPLAGNGVLRFARIVLASASDLLVANLLCCLLLLPCAAAFLAVLLTTRNFWLALLAGMAFGTPVGGALCGLEKSVLDIVRNHEGKPARAFWNSFRREWRQALLLGWLAYFEVMLIVYAILFHSAIDAFEMPVRLWTLIGLSILFLHVILTYALPQQVVMQLSFAKLCKNSLILFLANFGTSTLCLFLTLALAAVMVLFAPVSLPFLLLLGLALLSLIRLMFAWPVIDRAFSIEQKTVGAEKSASK